MRRQADFDYLTGKVLLMLPIKQTRLRRFLSSKPQSFAPFILSLLLAHGASAETCIAPPRPYVPSDARTARDYVVMVRRDFDLYMIDIQSYFRCLDEERVRAFEEAREVSLEYGRFLRQSKGD